MSCLMGAILISDKLKRCLRAVVVWGSLCNSRHLGPRRVKKGGSGTRSGHHFAWHRWLPWTAADWVISSGTPFFVHRHGGLSPFTRKVRPPKRVPASVYEENKKLPTPFHQLPYFSGFGHQKVDNSTLIRQFRLKIKSMILTRSGLQV